MTDPRTALEEAESKVPGDWWFYAALIVAACLKAKEAGDAN